VKWESWAKLYVNGLLKSASRPLQQLLNGCYRILLLVMNEPLLSHAGDDEDLEY
jgi:hypothetical protein